MALCSHFVGAGVVVVAIDLTSFHLQCLEIAVTIVDYRIATDTAKIDLPMHSRASLDSNCHVAIPGYFFSLFLSLLTDLVHDGHQSSPKTCSWLYLLIIRFGHLGFLVLMDSH